MSARAMSGTSLEAWNKIKGRINQSQARVLAAIYELGGRASLSDVAAHMILPKHQISGRFTELKNRGLIIVDGRKTNQGGNAEKVWKVVNT